MIASERKPTEQRLEEIASALFKLASLDFAHPLVCYGDDSLLDGVVGCINMLAEELQAHLAERAETSRVLEARVLARTAELEAAKERFRALIETSNVVPWELDASLAVLYIAPQAKVLFGDQASRFAGCAAMLDCTHPGDRERVRSALAALTAQGGQHCTLDYRVVSDQDSTFDVRSVVSSQQGGDGAITLLGVTIDVTQQRALETSLRHAQKLEAVGRLASGMAHEINTPIQFVGANVAFLGESFADLLGLYARTRGLLSETQAAEAAAFEKAVGFDYLEEEIPKAVTQSLEGVRHIAGIVKAMKAFSHQQRSGEQAPVDLDAALRAVVGVAQNETKDVADVVLELAELPPVVAFGSNLSQVFLNLIVNAAHAVKTVVKKTGKRGTIRVRTQREGDEAVICIEDTGGGIPDAIREQVFDPFFTTKDVGEGSGQGLALARNIIVERHGGALSFVSEAGHGTTFTVRLPIAGRR